jgi:hypothetical protein
MSVALSPLGVVQRVVEANVEDIQNPRQAAAKYHCEVLRLQRRGRIYIPDERKSNEWPRAVEMESLKNFACPPGCKKLVHRWRDRVRMPDVRVVE